MNTEYWVVFRGGVREGFHRDQVRAKVISRLKVEGHQLERMFSGQRVVLKKGLDTLGGRRFLDQLQQMGMDVVLEKASPASARHPTPAPTPPAAIRKPESWMSDSSFTDFERTQLNLARAEAVLNGNAPEPIAHPFIDPANTQLAAPANQPPATPGAAPQTSAEPCAPVVLHGSFLCGHCGTLHQLEASLRITPA